MGTKTNKMTVNSSLVNNNLKNALFKLFCVEFIYKSDLHNPHAMEDSDDGEIVLRELQRVQQELQSERQRRLEAEEQRARLKVRNKLNPIHVETIALPTTSIFCFLQRARDELAKTVLDLEHRAAEAEDEVDRLDAELQQNWNARSLLERTPSPPPLRDDERQELQTEIQLLSSQLDAERETHEHLASAAQTAQDAAAEAAARLEFAEQLIRSLQRSKGGGGRKAASSSSSSKTDADIATTERIASLKNARDRLIQALDVQAAETERLLTENSSLAAAVQEGRESASRWETQAQEALMQINYLKDLLEESAQWNAVAAAADENGTSSPSKKRSSSKFKQRSLEDRCQLAEQALLLQQSRCAGLELQVRALCAELTRVVTDSSGLYRAVHPLLADVEVKMAALVQNNKNRKQQQQQRQSSSSDGIE